MIFQIKRLIKLFLSYGNKWPIFQIDKKELKLSKEMDTMLLLEQTKYLRENGIIHFNDLILNQKHLSFDIIHESTRLKLIAEEFIATNPGLFST